MNFISRTSQNTDAITFIVDLCVIPHFRVGLSRAVHSADCRLDSSVKWSHLSSIVSYRHTNLGLLKSFKHSSESLLFLFDCEFARHPLCTELLHTKYTFNIWLTHSFDFFRVSDISINFTLRSSQIILWTFL